MFIVLYHWRIKPQSEKQFIESWAAITDFFLQNHDSLGSRLHQGNDGLFYGYAQWRTREQRENVFSENHPEIAEAIVKMRDAIEESFPEIVLKEIADYLV